MLRSYVGIILFLFSIVNVYADAVDCSKAQIASNETIALYLKAYSEYCTADKVTENVKRWSLANVLSQREFNSSQIEQLARGWDEIRRSFNVLLENVESGAHMKDTYHLLSLRADAAAIELRAVNESGKIPDKAAFLRDAWKIGANLVLFEHSNEYLALPLLEVDMSLNSDCTDKASELCRKTLEQGRELMVLWGAAEKLAAVISDSNIREIKKSVVTKEKMWNQYLYDSKPMLPPDFFITDVVSKTWKTSDQFPEGFRTPPRTQWFFMHPSIGMEYLPSANDGENVKPILFVEIIGANRWNSKDRWIALPVLNTISGFSAIVSYADRSSIKDVGYGGLITFCNVYSIGISRYGLANGVLISLDVANLWREKYEPKYKKLSGLMSRFN